jgi:hypothetical protein
VKERLLAEDISNHIWRGGRKMRGGGAGKVDVKKITSERLGDYRHDMGKNWLQDGVSQ